MLKTLTKKTHLLVHVTRLVLLLTILLSSTQVLSAAKLKNDILIPWSSELGIRWLSESQHKVDFFKLANHFESQNNKIYCGIASSVIILNALRVREGEKQDKLPLADSVLTKSDRQYISIFSPFFERYTQDNIFTPSSKSKLEILGKPITLNSDKKDVRDIGLQLEQLHNLLSSHDLDVKKFVVDKSLPLNTFRKHLKANLAKKNDYILVNYTRKSLGQKGGGHISPIAAYHESDDMVLIMDVNSNKADWVWLSVKRLFEAMATFDTIENRGYLLISDY